MADAKQGKAEDFHNGSSQSRVVLAKPRLGGFGSSSFASSSNKSSNPFGSVLRPPQLKPTINPFLKAADTANAEDHNKEQCDEDRLKDTKEETEVPKFVPLGANTSSRTGNQVPAPAQPTTSTSNASFVFGQNLSARVVMENVNNGEGNNGEATADHSSSNGSNELLFTSAAATVKENNQEEGSGEGSDSGAGLAAAAAEYERSHARPPPPAASFSLTGEEGEINVLQISCRLFAWESGSWRERGRGVLRLNDAAGGGTSSTGGGSGGGGSSGAARLVARVSGSLRVVLNTKLWPDMVVERAGTKSLRITAADAHQQVKLFLIMGAPLDITQLHRALTTRIAVSKRMAPVSTTCTLNATSQQAAERLEATTDESDYLDKDTESDKVEPQDSKNERLEASPKLKTEEYESNVDGMTEDHEAKSLKRKEPVEEETSPKRQCPEITNE